jgi:hypothetical protein
MPREIGVIGKEGVKKFAIPGRSPGLGQPRNGFLKAYRV